MLRPRPGPHRQHLGHGRAGLLPLRRGLRRRQRGGVIGFTRVLRSYQHARGCFIQLCSAGSPIVHAWDRVSGSSACPPQRRSQPFGSRGCTIPCDAVRQGLARAGADAVCCGRIAGPHGLMLCAPRPRRAADESTSTVIGTSMSARTAVPGAPVALAPLPVRSRRGGRVSCGRQARSGDDRDPSSSSRGISSSRVSLANIANIDLR
jgi:hypothetical protein